SVNPLPHSRESQRQKSFLTLQVTATYDGLFLVGPLITSRSSTSPPGTGLVHRCVIVQKDQLGFGFTVCGERVKLVQNVRPGGAAVKAGVQEGDRIIKVNGSLVSSMSHQEVVKLIKSGPYVALTLQGPSPSTHSLPLEPLQTDLTLNQRASLAGEAAPPPPPPLPSGLSSTPSQRITGPKPLQDPQVQKHATQILRKMLEQEEAELQVSMAPVLFVYRYISVSCSFCRKIQCMLSPIIMLYLNKYFLSSLNPFWCLFFFVHFPPDEHPFIFFLSFSQMDGPYQDIDLLKTRPAHMAVFMRYVFTQLLDPNPLVSLNYPLHMEDIRGPLSELQQLVLPEIQDQLQDYRNKQMMGLGSLFGEGDLQHLDGDTVKEKQVVDKQVTLLFVALDLSNCTQTTSPQLSGTKKEKDGEDKKRNPILKYIGKPRTTSQSSKLNRTNTFSTLEQEKFYFHRLTILIHFKRTLSMDLQLILFHLSLHLLSATLVCPSLHLSACTHRSASSTRVSGSPCRSVESPLALLPDVVALEDDVMDSKTWQETVTPQLLATLSPSEVDRQAVIYELFTTEVSHLRTLRVLDQVFYQKMRTVLTSDELACIFPNLPQVYELHASLCEAMKKRRESPIVQDIGDVMLTRFEGAAGDEFQEQASQLCCQQSQALELIKSKQRKDARFAHIIQECEASPHCRRLQLKDLLVSEMQRLTKYPLLLDKIIKYTEAGSSDLPLLQRVHTCCRGILQSVNEDVRESEHRQRLSEYQRRLDAAPQFKNVDLTTKRMIHEGPLTWKVNKEKLIEIQALLLSDCLVLLQKGPDDRLQLRYHSSRLGVSGGGSGDSKTSFSPLMNLASLLVRPVATGMLAAFCFSVFFLLIGVIKNITSDLRGVDCYLGSFTKTLPVLLHLCDSGNTFYLVMPIEQGESMTEDLNEPPTPTASHFPPPVEEVTSPQTQMEEEPAARGLEANQSETMQLEQEKETGHLQAAQHTHVIRNVDEIFHTIEELMTKLRHLKVSFVGKTATKEQLAQAVILCRPPPPHPPPRCSVCDY
uniref:Rho guanine nucleotide exchange factor (GEF) 11 n=1 Tax=Oreochromis niloticus TaxID=8128 RepID=A0A669C2D9_ORENI